VSEVRGASGTGSLLRGRASKAAAAAGVQLGRAAGRLRPGV
jgi:hypothetical protein